MRSNKNFDDQPPVLLGDRYHIFKPLGRGGSGKTWLAMDEWQPPLQCVIKPLLPNHSIPAYPSRDFLDAEVKRLAELGDHPQIPKLLDTFEQNGNPFIVQEWIEGWTLEQETKSAAPFHRTLMPLSLSPAPPIIPNTQGWYRLTSETETSVFAHNVALFLRARLATVTPPAKQSGLISSSQAMLKSRFLKQKFFQAAIEMDVVELLFRLMLSITLTCIGSMTLIYGFLEMERRSPAQQPTVQRSLRSSSALPIHHKNSQVPYTQPLP